MCFEELVLRSQVEEAAFELVQDSLAGPLGLVLVGDVRLGGVEGRLFPFFPRRARHGVDHGNRLHLVAEQLDADCPLLDCRDDLDDVPAHAEVSALELEIVAAVIDVDQAAQDLVPFYPVPHPQGQLLFPELDRRSQAENAGNGRHDNDVPPLEQGGHRPQPQAVDLLVEVDFLLDVGVGSRAIGFRLVVVVVADEVLYRVVGKIPLKLTVELRGKSLVVGNDEGRPVELLDGIGHREGLAASGDPQECLELLSASDPGYQLFYGPGLIARWPVLGNQVESGHALFALPGPRGIASEPPNRRWHLEPQQSHPPTLVRPAPPSLEGLGFTPPKA